MQGKTPYVELSDGDAKQTNAMYKCNGKWIWGSSVIYQYGFYQILGEY